MILRTTGLKAWIVILITLAFLIAVLIVMFHVLLFLLPIIIILVILGYLFRMLNKVKKGEKKDYVDVKYKVKR